MTAARLYRWFARDAEAEGHPNPLAVGHMCDVCGCRLDSATRPCPFGPHDEGDAPVPTCWRSECRNGCYYPVACSETPDGAA